MSMAGDFNNDGFPDVAGVFFGTDTIPAGLVVILHASFE